MLWWCVQEIADGPPAPWSLHEEDGDTLLTLVREYEGEQIQVFVSGEDQVCRRTAKSIPYLSM